ncbi:MAG: lysophospholipid acyltransferase family protein [Firmicutes bacterium]|nr:lysophospholipid acyltransferase family protein [Bacillota bacterium]MCM1401409.1 lysophospholipid acyltransferase family protein [Bacteroides sp.]MCM1477321.1 lysophospholipid acyltransferase family protein [Bacteroides sp.]
MNLSKALLKLAGWKVEITVPDYPKCIICVAPHTSNWDFVIGKLAYMSVGRKAGFLMKDSWFFFPMGCLFRALGGVPVARKHKGGSLVEQLVKRYKESDQLAIAITPEGTRSRTSNWHTGFLRIAYDANVPIVLGALDFGSKTVSIKETFTPTGNLEEDMRYVKNYYKPFVGKKPENFTTD